MKITSTILILAFLAGGTYFGYVKFTDHSEDQPYLLTTLDRGDIVQKVSATGTIEPVTKVIVGSQVSGNIKTWQADFNDRVSAGSVLAEIDPDRFQTTLNQAKAELAMARAQEEEGLVRFKDLERERSRIEKLIHTYTASENELLVAKAAADAAQATWHATQAAVMAAEARLNAAQVDLDRTIIRSPIDGIVISRNIDVGQTVAASLQAPELFLIANNLEKMQVNANVAEADVGLIHEGGPAHFGVDAFPDRVFHGVISQIRNNATILDGVVTYVTLIEVENPDLALRPGMTANVTFEVARAESVVRIPNSALRFDPRLGSAAGGESMAKTRGPTVWKLSPKDDPLPVSITIGLSDGSFTQLVSDELKEGDQVITERNWRAGGRGGRPDPSRTFR